MQDYEVTEDLLTPQKNKPASQGPKRAKKPRKTPKKNPVTALVVVAIIAALVVGSIVVYQVSFRNSYNEQLRQAEKDSDSKIEKPKANNADNAKRGNYNVNLVDYSQTDNLGAGGRVAANSKDSYACINSRSYDNNYQNYDDLEELSKVNKGDDQKNIIDRDQGFSGISINVYDGWVYYISNNAIVRYNMKTKEKQTIASSANGNPLVFQIYKGKIYELVGNNAFSSESSFTFGQTPKSTLYSMDLDGSDQKEISDDLQRWGKGFSIDHDHIYYETARSFNEDGSASNAVYKQINLDGSNGKTILDLSDQKHINATNFYVQDGQLYYTIGKQEVIYNLMTGKAKTIDSPDGNTIIQFIYYLKAQYNIFITENDQNDSSETKFNFWYTLANGGDKEFVVGTKRANYIYLARNCLYYYNDCGEEGIFLYYLDPENGDEGNIY